LPLFLNSLIQSNIVGNEIGADGAKFISEGMKKNKAIADLDLRCMFNISFNFSQALPFAFIF